MGVTLAWSWRRRWLEDEDEAASGRSGRPQKGKAAFTPLAVVLMLTLLLRCRVAAMLYGGFVGVTCRKTSEGPGLFDDVIHSPTLDPVVP